jgi:hypothetical protein
LETVLAPVLPASSFFSVQEDARTDQYMEASSSEFWDVFGIMHKYNLNDFKGYSARLPEFIVKVPFFRIFPNLFLSSYLSDTLLFPSLNKIRSLLLTTTKLENKPKSKHGD